MQHSAVILAAGSSRRLGRPKALLQLDGQSLLRRTVQAVLSTHPQSIQVVLRPDDQAALAELEGLPITPSFCPEHSEGMAASLRLAVNALPASTPGLLVCVCDQIHLGAAHLQALCALWQRKPEHAAASGYAGIFGVPAILPGAWFSDVANLHGDQGARVLLRRRAGEVSVLVEERLAVDLDRPEQLLRMGGGLV